MRCIFTIVPIVLTVAVVLSCAKEQGKPAEKQNKSSVRYSVTIKPMVATKCAIEGCHVGVFPFGDFTSYTDLKKRVDNGKVESLVIENRIMPPAGSPPLSAQEISDLQCWIDNGAPEN